MIVLVWPALGLLFFLVFGWFGLVFGLLLSFFIHRAVDQHTHDRLFVRLQQLEERYSKGQLSSPLNRGDLVLAQALLRAWLMAGLEKSEALRLIARQLRKEAPWWSYAWRRAGSLALELCQYHAEEWIGRAVIDLPDPPLWVERNAALYLMGCTQGVDENFLQRLMRLALSAGMNLDQWIDLVTGLDWADAQACRLLGISRRVPGSALEALARSKHEGELGIAYDHLKTQSRLIEQSIPAYANLVG